MAGDHDAVVDLALRAWSPVFASMEDILGRELSILLHGEDWRAYQARSVSQALSAAGNQAWVAEHDAGIEGFVVAGSPTRTGGSARSSWSPSIPHTSAKGWAGR